MDIARARPEYTRKIRTVHLALILKFFSPNPDLHSRQRIPVPFLLFRNLLKTP